MASNHSVFTALFNKGAASGLILEIRTVIDRLCHLSVLPEAPAALPPSASRPETYSPVKEEMLN